MQLNNRLRTLEQLTDEHMVRWGDALGCWRMMTTLFDQALAQQVSDEARNRIWCRVIRGMWQEARGKGMRP